MTVTSCGSVEICSEPSAGCGLPLTRFRHNRDCKHYVRVPGLMTSRGVHRLKWPVQSGSPFHT